MTNICDQKVILNIFIAKGRPSDNPLVVHVSSMDMIDPLVDKITHKVQALADKF